MSFDNQFLQVLLSLVIFPYIAWVTSSIFSQRQEIAVLKQILAEIKEIVRARL